MKYKNIIWDWNGTILDDTAAAFEATNILLKKYGYPTITLEFYRDNIDTPVVNFYNKIFDLSKQSMETLDKEWGVLYNELSKKIGLHKDIDKALDYFRKENCRQIILSAFKTAEITKYAESLNVKQYFGDILGTEGIAMESKTVRGKRYIRENNLDPKETLYIGDTLHDYETAQQLGTDCILVSCGQQSPKLLNKCETTVCESFAEFNTIFN
ncbi:MAG: HAD family hydrolase [Eubacterium sp.]